MNHASPSPKAAAQKADPQPICADRPRAVTTPPDPRVNVHGHLVSTSDVEAVLYEQAQVFEAITFAHDHELFAVVVPADATLDEPQLRAHCRARLPVHAQPSRLVLVTRLPRTHTGQIDRARAERDILAAQASGAPPWKASMHALMRAW